MISLGNISKHFRFFILNYKSVLRCSSYDRSLNYFRSRSEYKNSLVFINDISDCKVAGPSFSFLLKEQNADAEGFFYHLMQRENVMKLSSMQLKDIMCLMANGNFDKVKYVNVLKYLDEKCALGVERWTLDLSLCILDAWIIILGPKAFRKHYYTAITSLWSRKMKKCSKYNVLLMLYFIGLNKISPPFLMELFEDKLENFATDLTDEELAIACLSFFKTSTRINSDILLKKLCNAAQNFLLKNDRFNLISILKCLRLSRYFDQNLMRMLQEYVIKEHASFNFVECTNFLASFAAKNLYSPELYSCLEEHGISLLIKEDSVKYDTLNIEKIHPSQRSRLKDISRFLWGMAFVGHVAKDESLNFILKLLDKKLVFGEFERSLPCLIDCFQSLILLGHYPQLLMEYVMKPTFKHEISKIDKAKPKYQAYFIYRSAYIENYLTETKKFKYLNHIPKNLENDIKDRKGFLDILNYLNNNLNKNSFKCCYIIPHIMISGIFVATKCKENECSQSLSITKTLFKLIEDGIISKQIKDILHKDKFYTSIEILDPSVCVHENILPLGLMKTKLRQLNKLGINVITFTPEEISALMQPKGKSCVKLASLYM